MDLEEKEKIVKFEIWCPKCVNQKLDETKDPCNECLDQPVNEFGLPIHYKKKE